MMIKTDTIRCINGELLFSNEKLFVFVVSLNDIQNFPMCVYDFIVEFMNIHEIKAKLQIKLSPEPVMIIW